MHVATGAPAYHSFSDKNSILTTLAPPAMHVSTGALKNIYSYGPIASGTLSYDTTPGEIFFQALTDSGKLNVYNLIFKIIIIVFKKILKRIYFKIFFCLIKQCQSGQVQKVLLL